MAGIADLVNTPAAARPSATEAEQRAALVLFEVAAHGGAQARAIGAAAAEGALADLADIRPRSFISVTGSAEAAHAADLFAAVAGAHWDVPVVRSGQLPAWVGPLDVLLVTGSDPGDPILVEAVSTALRRGVTTVVSAPLEGPLRAAAGAGAIDLAPKLAGGESFGFVQALAAHVAVARAVLSNRGAAFGEVSALADHIDEEIYRAHPSRPLFENPARALAARMRDRRVVLVGDGPAAVAAARQGTDVLLRVAGEPAQATDLATALMAGERLASQGLSGEAALFHDPELDGPLPAAPRVFVLATGRESWGASSRLGSASGAGGLSLLPDAEIISARSEEGGAVAEQRFPRQEELADLPKLAVLAQRIALASAYLRSGDN